MCDGRGNTTTGHMASELTCDNHVRDTSIVGHPCRLSAYCVAACSNSSIISPGQTSTRSDTALYLRLHHGTTCLRGMKCRNPGQRCSLRHRAWSIENYLLIGSWVSGRRRQRIRDQDSRYIQHFSHVPSHSSANNLSTRPDPILDAPPVASQARLLCTSPPRDKLIAISATTKRALIQVSTSV